MAGKIFKALANGTLANPYRFVPEGKEVELTEAEAEFYKNSKWLVPLKKAREIAEQPLMGHMNIHTPNNSVLKAMEMINAQPINPAYQAQMSRITAGEKATDEKINAANAAAEAAQTPEKPQPDAAAQGTGNLNVLG